MEYSHVEESGTTRSKFEFIVLYVGQTGQIWASEWDLPCIGYKT